MRFITESVFIAIVFFVLLPLAVGLTCGFLSAWVAGRKLRRRKIWFLIGFFFPVAGLVTALVIPSLREPYALRIRRLRKAIEADIKDGDRGFKQRTMGLLKRVKELDEAANQIQGRLHQVETYLGEPDPYCAAGRRSRPLFTRARRRERAGGLRAETEVMEEELITRRRLEEKAEKFRVQLKNTATLMERMGHRIKRLSFGAEDTAPTDKELQEIIEEIEVEVEALEELHDKT